jgi:diguanylate cyclase (GGDEF)-like protein/PAS domain S-box-containing protein
MWAAVRELMDQFDEAVIVLDADGEIAVVNRAAQGKLGRVGGLDETSGVRVLRVGGGHGQELGITPPIRELDEVSAQLPVVLSIRSLEKYVYISPAHEKVYGTPADDFFADVNAFVKLVHPEDRDMAQRHFDSDRGGQPQDYECRVRHGDGTWRRLRIRVHPFFDAASGQLLVASLAEDVTELRPARLRKEVLSGPGQAITSMADFRKALDHSVDQWTTAPEAPFFAVAFIDLARFRAVNDSFGYAEGDRLLEEVGRRIEQALPARNKVAGFGSDRFGMLIRTCAEASQVEALVRGVLLVLSTPVMLGENTIQVSARAGIAYPRGMDCNGDMMLRNADAALQLAKQRREQLVVSTISRASKSMEQSSLEFDLSRALDNDEFFFEFQPVFDPLNGNVKLLEALVRWRHPRLGVISPSSFISLAEDSGLVLRLDMNGLERLARQLDYWRATEPRILEVPVSINISGRHFPNFVMEKQFHRLLKLPALRAAKIVFEITESVFVDSNPRTAAGLERLREAGVEIWLDDFGEGYSSFRYLAHFPVDGIKISESFVKHCEKEEKSRVILSSLQTLARGLGVRTVVEGIENRMQLETLKTMGFDAVQGYYLSKPLAAKDIPGLFGGPTKAKSRKTSA